MDGYIDLTDDRYGRQAGGAEERGSFGCWMVSVSLSEWGCAAHLPPLVCAWAWLVRLMLKLI